MTINAQHPWEHLCTFAEQELRARHIPGAAIGIAAGDEVFAAGFGVTNLDHPLPVQATTLFQVGSITKTFTGAAIMRLIETGKLQLSTRVREIAPEWRVLDEQASAEATVWHLLTHTGGWLGDFFIDTGAGENALGKYVARMVELPQVAPIGAAYSYNNAAFVVLGHLVEVIAGKPFEQFVRESLFEPLGLADCHFNAETLMTKRFAVGHRVSGDAAEVITPWGLPRCGAPMGSIVATAPDLLSYARMLLDLGKAPDGRQVLAAESVQAMQTPQAPIWRDREAIGLAWHIERLAGETFIHHGGATHGQGAWLEFCPGKSFVIAVLANADTTGQLARAIRKQALRDFLGIEMPGIELPEETFQPLSLEQMREIEGRYVLPKIGFVEIRSLAGERAVARLIGQEINTGGFPTEDTPPEPNLPPYTLESVEPDRLVVADGKAKGTQCHVLRDDAGRMRWFRMGGRIHLREPLA
jgi:CubicO group peptidase (beta-lactamase class C family)